MVYYIPKQSPPILGPVCRFPHLKTEAEPDSETLCLDYKPTVDKVQVKRLFLN